MIRFDSVKKQILFIFISALFIRLSYLAIVPARSMAMDDSGEWNRSALRFMKGEGFLTHTEDLDPKRPPIYPLFLAANYLIFGEQNFNAVKISQSVLNSLACIAIYGLTYSICGQNPAFWTGILSAFYPPLIVYCEILQSETLFGFVLILFGLCWILTNRISGWKLIIAMGILMGILNLTRGTTIFLPFFILLIPVFLKEERKKISQYVVMVLLSLLITAPWTWRNYKVYHTFIPIVSGGPELLWFGTLPISSQKEYGNASEFSQLNVPTDLKESESYYWKMAMTRISQNPLSYGFLTVKKFFYFWFKPIGHEIIYRKSVFIAHIFLISHWILILLFLIGMVSTFPKRNLFFPIYVLIGYFVLFHTLLMPMPRFRQPIEPFLLLFVSLGIQKVWKKFKGEEVNVG